MKKRVTRTFGFPRVTYTDNGTQFRGGELPCWLKENGVRMFYCGTGHVASVGLAEAYVKLVKKGL
jgi:hypothetical protein